MGRALALAGALLMWPVAACGSAESTTAASLASVSEWCSTYHQRLPALASPNPDGRELETLDQHIAKNQAIAAGAPGVPAAATEAVGKVAAQLVAIRQRVAKGERLVDVLQEALADDNNVLIVAGTAADAEAAKICP